MGELWLAGRLAVVTGASRGIVAATPQPWRAGGHVVLAARDREALDRVARRIREAGGRPRRSPKRRQAQWHETRGVNLTGTFLCCRAAFAAMAASGEGRIVNIASLSGVYATDKFPGLAAYNVSKYGVIGLTEAIAVEGKAHGISSGAHIPLFSNA